MGFQLPNPQLVSWTPEFWTRGPDRVYLEKLRPDREDVCRAMLQHWPFTPELVWKLRYWLPYVEPLSWKKTVPGTAFNQGRAELGEPSFHSFLA